MRAEKDSPISIVHDSSLRYPDAEEYFSPQQAFPEYHGNHFSKKPNSVYPAVRECLRQAGLDRDNFGKPTWNPFGGFITPGQKVFVLCNFVQHKLRGNLDRFFAKCTHAAVVRPLIDYTLIALAQKGSVRFGNAPLQSCEWGKVIAETGAQRLEDFYRKFGPQQVPVILTDLRQFIIHRRATGAVETRFQGNDSDVCVPVNLGADSLLDQLYSAGRNPRFRVLDYDHRRTQNCHDKGKHIYLVSKHVLESDVVISVPKLKTHEKVGVTCGIKGCVGAVAHKDCLAHHRYGSPRAGGDEYPNALAFLKPLSALHDSVYQKKPGVHRNALHFLNQYGRMVVRRFTRSLSGSWPGNDTCWRMAVDLARIVSYADREGHLRPTPQRSHVMLTDGIIGGEADGPLSPRPVALGYLAFSRNIVAGDYVNCQVMGFNPECLPMIREAFRVQAYPLVTQDPSSISVLMNDKEMGCDAIPKRFGRRFLPAREWRRHL